MDVRPGYKQTDVGAIPEDWAFEPLRSHMLSSAYGPRFSGEHYDDRGNIALLRTTDLDDEGTLSLAQMPRATLPAEQFTTHFLLPGDFLVSRSGTCGLSTVFPGYEIPVLPGAFLIRLRFARSVDVGFLKFYFNSEFGKRHLQQLTEGGVQKNIRGSALVELSFPLPPSPEQRAIAEALSDVDELLGGLDRLIVKKRDLKQAAMQQLLTGQTRLPGFHGEWEVKRLDELGTWKGGMTPSMQNPDYWQSGTVPWASSGDVKSAQLTQTGLSITQLAVRRGATTLLPPNSIMLVTRSGILRKYLPVAMNMVPMAINQDIKALIPSTFLSPAYLLHVLIGHGNHILKRCMKSGTTVESVEFRWLRAFSIPIPDFAEQTAIAEVLNDMDAELAALEQRREKTRALRQAMMQELLTGKIRLV